MAKMQAEPDLSREEREAWVEPEFVVVSLKKAMSGGSPSTGDGTVQYS